MRIHAKTTLTKYSAVRRPFTFSYEMLTGTIFTSGTLPERRYYSILAFLPGQAGTRMSREGSVKDGRAKLCFF